MKKQLFYPAVFEENEDGRFTVVFPDLEGCLTQGDNMDESYKMATEVLGMTITYLEENKRPIPAPSKPKGIKLEDSQIVSVLLWWGLILMSSAAVMIQERRVRC